MNSIAAQELAQIQSDVAFAVCDQPCVVTYPTLAKDVLGTQTEVYAVSSVTKAGMTQPTAGQLQNYDFLLGSLKAWQVKLPIGTVVQEKWHLIISGEELVVQVLLSPRSFPGLLTVLASEIK